MSQNEVCDNCPIAAAYSVGLSIINQCEVSTEIHRSEDRHKAAVGATAMSKRILDGAVAILGCDGPAASNNGYMVCPHQNTVGLAQTVVIGPGPNPNLVFQKSWRY